MQSTSEIMETETSTVRIKWRAVLFRSCAVCCFGRLFWFGRQASDLFLICDEQRVGLLCETDIVSDRYDRKLMTWGISATQFV